jgi:hypothetical protein
MSDTIPLRDAGLREKEWSKDIVREIGIAKEELSFALYDPSLDVVIFPSIGFVSKVNRP